MKLRLSSLSQRFLDDFLIALLKSRFGTLCPGCLQYVFHLTNSRINERYIKAARHHT